MNIILINIYGVTAANPKDKPPDGAAVIVAIVHFAPSNITIAPIANTEYSKFGLSENKYRLIGENLHLPLALSYMSIFVHIIITSIWILHIPVTSSMV